MLKLYRQQNSEPELQKLIAENDDYFNNVVKLRIQDIRPEEKFYCNKSIKFYKSGVMENIKCYNVTHM